MTKPILLAVSAVLLSLNFINTDINERLAYDNKEEFNSQLSYLNSIDKLEIFIDNKASAGHISPNTVDYVTNVSQVIGDRFYHGFSHFSVGENWIAALELSKKDTKTWETKGDKIVKRYRDERGEATSTGKKYNILLGRMNDLIVVVNSS